MSMIVIRSNAAVIEALDNATSAGKSRVEVFFNQCHGAGGKFCSRPGRGGGGGSGGSMPKGKKRLPDAVYEKGQRAKAIAKVAKGEDVSVGVGSTKGVKRAYTLIKDIGKKINSDKTAGRTGQKYNLCKVSVPGTNLFCGESLSRKREDMPQFSGQAKPGSIADKTFPKNKGGEVDGTAAYSEYLKSKGVKVTLKEVTASELKASQQELRGDKVNGMVDNKNFDPAGEPIYVSRDGYVIDGHHRWAAQVVRDMADGKTGDLPLNVRMVDMDIKDVLDDAKAWADKVGIVPKTL
jgi:hypothetical protein